MPGISNYHTRIDEVWNDGQLDIEWRTIPEAMAHLRTLRQMERELGTVRREVVLDMQAIRESFEPKKTSAAAAAGAAVFSRVFWRSSAGALDTPTGDSSRVQLQAALEPYRELARKIDVAILLLDQYSLQIEKWIMAES